MKLCDLAGDTATLATLNALLLSHGPHHIAKTSRAIPMGGRSLSMRSRQRQIRQRGRELGGRLRAREVTKGLGLFSMGTEQAALQVGEILVAAGGQRSRKRRWAASSDILLHLFGFRIAHLTHHPLGANSREPCFRSTIKQRLGSCWD